MTSEAETMVEVATRPAISEKLPGLVATMVERIASALEPDAWSRSIIPIWPTRSMLRKRACTKARAVLTALLDPTEEMVEAAKPWPAHWPKDGPDFPVKRAAYLADQMTARSLFRTMIQAALQPRSETQ